MRVTCTGHCGFINKDLSSEQFFEIISIERSDDGNFEAVLEVSESGKNGPGITETGDFSCIFQSVNITKLF